MSANVGVSDGDVARRGDDARNIEQHDDNHGDDNGGDGCHDAACVLRSWAQFMSTPQR